MPPQQHSIIVLVNENSLLKHQVAYLHDEINRLKELIDATRDASCNVVSPPTPPTTPTADISGNVAPPMDISGNVLARISPSRHMYTLYDENHAPRIVLPMPNRRRRLVPTNPNPEPGVSHMESDRCFRYRPYYQYPSYPWWYDDDGYYSG
jgi:hypothetical protein